VLVMKLGTPPRSWSYVVTPITAEKDFWCFDKINVNTS
jgi:hypothetical protein